MFLLLPLHPQVCDRLGLYVVDEANIETHGMLPTPSRLARDPDWHSAHMERLQARGYRRVRGPYQWDKKKIDSQKIRFRF